MLISTDKQLAFRLLSETQQHSLVSGVGYVGLYCRSNVRGKASRRWALRNHDAKVLWMAAARHSIEGAAGVEGACLRPWRSLTGTGCSFHGGGRISTLSLRGKKEGSHRPVVQCKEASACFVDHLTHLCLALNASLRFQFVCLQWTLLPQPFSSTFNALRHHVLHRLHYLDQTTHHFPTLTISLHGQKHLGPRLQNRAKDPRTE